MYNLEGNARNVTPLTLDNTLTVEGASADAKAVGDAINETKRESKEQIEMHGNTKSNPHNVTATQIGLGNCDNTSDKDKPVSTAQAAAINTAKASGDAAQKTANEAKKLGQDAMPKAGGTFSGDVNMGGCKLTNLPEPTSETEAATKGFVEGHVEEYVARKIGESTDGKHLFFAAYLNSTSWQGSSAPYTQSVDVEGILETDRPHYAPVYSDAISTKRLEKKAWDCVSDTDTRDGSVLFTCFDKKPTFGVNVMIEVNRA